MPLGLPVEDHDLVSKVFKRYNNMADILSSLSKTFFHFSSMTIKDSVHVIS